MNLKKILPFLSIKTYLPNTLIFRSFLILAVPILLIQIVTTYIFFDRHWHRMSDQLAYSVAGEVAIIVHQMEAETSSEKANNLEVLTERNLGLGVGYIDNALLKPVKKQHKWWGDIVRKNLSSNLDEILKKPYEIKIKITEKIVRVNVQLDTGVVSISVPKKRLFSSSGYAFLLWMFAVSFLLLSVAMLFMRNQIRPIKRLALAADRFGKGRDVPFLKIEGAREVRQAAQSFVDMRKRLDRQIQQRTSMLAGVSHDLRTPLTRMKLQAAMLKDDEDSKNLKADIESMERMISAYLEFAKGDGDEVSKRVNLNEVINGIVKTANRESELIELDMPEEDVSLFLKPVSFERCLWNVISNAQKYAEQVWISIEREDSTVSIAIDDNGPGIDEMYYDDVFKPFFREDVSRNSKTGGVGLGLPIAQDIVLSHGGDIALSKSRKGGLRVIIKLPA